MRKAVIVSAMFLCVTGAGWAKDSSDNPFNGKWVMEKSNNNAEGLVGLEQRIKQSGSEVNFDSKFAEPANGIVPLLYLGIMTNNFKLNTDGSEVVNQVGPFMVTTKTTMTGNVMETEWRSQDKGEPIQGHWTRTISDDGKHMTLKVTESSTHGQQGSAEITFKKK